MQSRHWPDFTFALRDGERRQGASLAAYSRLFIANMHNRGQGGNLGVYRRTAPTFSKPQGKLIEFFGPRVQYHAANPSVGAELFIKTEVFLMKRLTKIVDRVLG